MTEQTPNEYNDEDLISKTQRKREMHELQQFGEQLMTLKQTDLERLPLTDELLKAIEESRRITSHEARRRHSQFIGKLLRNTDSDLICDALEKIHDPNRQKRNQDWLDRLIQQEQLRDTNTLIQELLSWYPYGDRQHLRNLVRNLIHARVAPDAPPTPATREAREKFRRERKRLQKYITTLEKQLPLY